MTELIRSFESLFMIGLCDAVAHQPDPVESGVVPGHGNCLRHGVVVRRRRFPRLASGRLDDLPRLCRSLDTPTGFGATGLR